MEARPIPGASAYKITEDGDVYAFADLRHPSNYGKKMTPVQGRGPYLQVRIKHDDGKFRSRYLHQLVAETFIGPRPEKADVDHINGDKKDNRLENIRYCTRLENQNNKNNRGQTKWQYYASRKVIATAPDGTEKLYDNIKAVCKELHFHQNAVSCNIRGVKRNCGMRGGKPHLVDVKNIQGYTFRWADPDKIRQ